MVQVRIASVCSGQAVKVCSVEVSNGAYWTTLAVVFRSSGLSNVEIRTGSYGELS